MTQMNKKRKLKGNLQEKDVLKKLGISSWSELPKDKYDDLAALIPQTDRKDAVRIFNKLPDYVQVSGELISLLKTVSVDLVKQGDDSHKKVLEGYQKTLDSLQKKLDQPRLLPWTRNKITKQMLEICDKMAKISEEHKNWIQRMVGTIGGAAVGLVAIVGLILGLPTGNNNK